jgi:pimeloyl-ACP methyl ester carboxylesterase
MKNILRVIKIIAISILAVVILSAAYLFIQSPGKAQPITDNQGREIPGSISSVEKWKIGNIDQYVIIRGANKNNPVILFLHGGPGSPEFAFFRAANRSIEKYFTVVHWEQRGAGKSFSADIPAASMNVEQFLSDTLELTEMVRKKFNTDKIYLLGHSWGSLLGALAVKKRPDFYRAFIGVGQAVNLTESERIAWEWVLDEARKSGNAEAVKELEKIGPAPYGVNEFYKKGIELKWVIHFGGGMVHNTDGLYLKLLNMIVHTPEYTVADKINFFRGNQWSIAQMWDKILKVNLFESAKEFSVPVFILQGEYDYQVSTPLVKKYFAVLKAPSKKYYSFMNSAHGTIYEEPELFHKIMVEDVLGVK